MGKTASASKSGTWVDFTYGVQSCKKFINELIKITDIRDKLIFLHILVSQNDVSFGVKFGVSFGNFLCFISLLLLLLLLLPILIK